MKKLLIVAICVAGILSAHAQGQINFFNLGAGVTTPDGTPLAGAAYQGQLYVGADSASLAPVGSPKNFAAAGLVAPSTVTVDGIASGTAVVVQMRAWEVASGATFDTSLLRGASNEINLTLGGGGNPPTPAPGLTGLQAFSLEVVPEPSTILLGLLGAGALLLRRRK